MDEKATEAASEAASAASGVTDINQRKESIVQLSRTTTLGHDSEAGRRGSSFDLSAKTEQALPKPPSPTGLAPAPIHDLSDDDDEEREHDGTVVTFPDGGLQAWLVVIGASHTLFATFGFVNAWGIFQDYYETEMFPDESSSNIAWIGSLQYCLIFLPSLFMGRLVDLNKFQYPFWIAAIIYPASIIITAEVTEYYQAVLSQGILFGLSAGVMFCPSIAVTGQWFHKRRAFAIGIVTGASSIGGVAFPILVHNCLGKIGYKWTLRVCGLIILYATVVSCFTLRTRLPAKNVSGGLFNPRAFRQPEYALFALSCFLVMAGLYTPLSYFDITGASAGLGDYANYLVPVANAGSLLGRVGPGVIADRIGPVNILIPGLLGSAATTFAWPYAVTKGSLTTVASINGLFQGTFVSLIAPGVAQLGSTDDLGRRFGMISTICGLGCLIGPPISGAILNVSNLNNVSYYAGVVLVAGCISMTASRWFRLKKWFGKM